MNKFIGLVVLGSAMVIGLGSIAGCPKTTSKTQTGTGKTDTGTGTTPKVVDTPKVDTPKVVDTPKIDTPKIDTPKIDTPKIDTPKDTKATGANSASMLIGRPAVAMNAVITNRNLS